MPSSLKAQSVGRQVPYQLIPVTDLSGGLDQRKAPTLVQPHRSRVLRNWSLREPGALAMFPGWISHSTSSLGSGRPQGGQRTYLGASTPFTLVAWNGGVYKPTDAGVWGSAVSTGWSTTNQIFFPYDRDIVVILDGAAAGKKSVNGTTWTNFGIAAPSTAPTAANLAGGSLVSGNQYEFSYSGRDDALLHEGNESARVLHTPSGANLSVRLTLTAHQDSTDQVDTLIVYGRDVTAGETVRRRIGTVADPGTGTVTFDVTTNNWGSGSEAPSDHDVPPALKFAVYWKNRWWGVDATVGNRLRFTQIFENQSWPSEFYIDLPFEKGDDIAAVIPQGDTLVVWGQGKPFLVIGQTSLDFEVRPSGAAQAGALGFRAVDALEEGIIHAAAEGIYLFDGATDRLLSDDIDGLVPTAIGWRTYITTASAAELARTPLVYHQASKEIAIGVTNLYLFGAAGEWILDLNRTRIQEASAWTTTDRTIGGYIKYDGNEPALGVRGQLYSWSLTIGKLYQERTGSSADGGNLTADYAGPVFSAEPAFTHFPGLLASYEPNSGSFAIECLVDGISMGSQSIDIGAGLAVYGTAIYGTSLYAGGNRRQVPLDLPLEAQGWAVQLKASYVGTAAFRWHGYKLMAIPETLPRGL